MSTVSTPASTLAQNSSTPDAPGNTPAMPTIDSGTVETAGADSPGIVALGSDVVAVTSASVVTQGDNSPGILAEHGSDHPITQKAEAALVRLYDVWPAGRPAG